MTDPRHIKERLNPHINRVLTVAEASLPPGNYPAFRKFVLDEFGVNGFETELEELCRSEGSRHG
jgi:hypothetical protein